MTHTLSTLYSVAMRSRGGCRKEAWTKREKEGPGSKLVFLCFWCVFLVGLEEGQERMSAFLEGGTKH